MRRRDKFDGQDATHWIENYCVVPGGSLEGRRVKLTAQQREILRRLYDAPGERPQDVLITGDLAAYVALLHTCGPPAADRDPVPPIEVDGWTLWRSTSPELREVLERVDGAVRCPALGTRFPPVAA